MVGRCTFSCVDNNGAPRFVVLFLGSHREQDAVEPLGAIRTLRRAVLPAARCRSPKGRARRGRVPQSEIAEMT